MDTELHKYTGIWIQVDKEIYSNKEEYRQTNIGQGNTEIQIKRWNQMDRWILLDGY